MPLTPFSVGLQRLATYPTLNPHSQTSQQQKLSFVVYTCVLVPYSRSTWELVVDALVSWSFKCPCQTSVCQAGSWTDGAMTTWSGRRFQSATTRWLNEYFRTSRRHLDTASFELRLRSPYLLAESWKNWSLSIFSLPEIVLNASIRSPLRLLVSRVVRPSWPVT